MADETKPAPVPQKPQAAAPAPTAPQAPAVHTDSKAKEYTRAKVKELEQRQLEAEQLQGKKRLEAVAQIRAQIRELRQREAARFSGGDPLTPRGNMIRADEAIEKHPEFHYRYINVNAPGRGDNARALGYERVTHEDGGKELGELVLFRIPMERYAQTVGQRDRLTKERLQKVTDDLKGEVRDMAKFLQSRGVDIDPDRLGVFESNAED